MAVNNGSYMALTSPITIGTLRGRENISGNVYVLDLGKIDRNGRFPSSAVVTLESGSFPVARGGKWPQYISAGQRDGEFILSSAKDYNSGLLSLKVALDDAGNLTGQATGQSTSLSPAASDSGWLQRMFQQNIQRAAGNVVVQYQGREYALVADYNFLFNDPHFQSSDNFGYGKQIGGKIGVIADPFGKQGKPFYLGATTPIVGGTVDHLTLADDGKLYADVFIEEVTSNTATMYKSLFVWDAGQLVQAALDAQARGQKLTTPIDRVTGAKGQVAVPARYDGAVSGQYFPWIYGIGHYNDPNLPLVLAKADLRTSYLTLVPEEAPGTPVKTLAQTLNPNDYLIASIVLKGFDLLISGGYMERYDQRVEQYNKHELTYDQFVQANIKDALFTGFATVATFGVGGKLLSVAANAKSLTGKFLGGAASGAAAGTTFDTILQTGLIEVGKTTAGVSGQENFNWSQALMTGGFGGVLGGAMGVLPTAVSKLYEYAPALVQNMMKKLGEVVGLGVNKNKLLSAQKPTEELPMASQWNTTKGTSNEIRLVDDLLPDITGQTQIRYKGKLLSLTPKSDSMTIGQATAWYRAEMDKLAGMIDKTLGAIGGRVDEWRCCFNVHPGGSSYFARSFCPPQHRAIDRRVARNPCGQQVARSHSGEVDRACD
ncbi:MAG: hypothetical protein FD135_3044 [Comamonadaceae bacterium]|nr:MAG: hypothetical protein FD135_3044 [Comamonadaceae bacterium]